MLARRDQTAEVESRPFNNLLRRLNAGDYALLAPHLAQEDAKPGAHKARQDTAVTVAPPVCKGNLPRNIPGKHPGTNGPEGPHGQQHGRQPIMFAV